MDLIPIASLVLLASILVSYIGLIIWGYRDAEARGKSGALVAFLMAISYVLGFIAWIAIRPEQSETPEPPGALETVRTHSAPADRIHRDAEKVLSSMRKRSD